MRRVDLREMPAFAWGGGRCVYGDEKSVKAVHGLVSSNADMLAVLRRIRDSYSGYIPDFIEEVNAAIAKAEGRTRDHMQNDGTEIAVGGEPGATEGKSE